MAPSSRLAYPEFPKVAQAWTTRQNVNYNDAVELMKYPPVGVRIQVFSPLRPLPVGALTIEPNRIKAALVLGHDEASEQMKKTR